MKKPTNTDRYQSFCGIECDAQANQLIKRLKDQLLKVEADNKWCMYFKQKFEQQIQYNYDNLHFVGAQLNPLCSFFEEIDDTKALDILWKLEQECC